MLIGRSNLPGQRQTELCGLQTLRYTDGVAKTRAHWDAVARAFADDERQRDRDAARLTEQERVLLGLRMGASSGAAGPTELELQQQGLAKARLHTRWRELQLARGRKS
jgi:hypothetical protein